MRPLHFVLLLLLSQILILLVAGKDLFVSPPLGTDANDCSTEALACKTIAHAVSIAQANDVVVLLGGTHEVSEPIVIDKSLTVAAAASQSAPVLIKHRPSDTSCVMTGMQTVESHGKCAVFRTSPPDDLNLLSFTLSGQSVKSGNGIAVDSTAVVLVGRGTNVWIDSVKAYNMKMAMIYMTCNVLKQDCTFEANSVEVSDSTIALDPSARLAASRFIGVQGFSSTVINNLYAKNIHFSGNTTAWLASENIGVRLFIASAPVRTSGPLNSLSISGLTIEQCSVSRLTVSSSRVSISDVFMSKNTYTKFIILSSQTALESLKLVENDSTALFETSASSDLLSIKGDQTTISTILFDNNAVGTLLAVDSPVLRGTDIKMLGRRKTLLGCARISSTRIVELSESSFEDCISGISGGAMLITGGDSSKTNLKLWNATFARCSSQRSGGALSVTSNTVLMHNVKFDQCIASDFGGAIHSIGGKITSVRGLEELSTLDLNKITINACSADSAGGIYVEDSDVIIEDCTIQNSIARATGGGGIMASRSHIAFRGKAAFVGDVALNGGNGGAALFKSCDVAFSIPSTNITISKCRAYKAGGFAFEGTVTQPTYVAGNSTVSTVPVPAVPPISCSQSSATVSGACLAFGLTAVSRDTMNSWSNATSFGSGLEGMYGIKVAARPSKLSLISSTATFADVSMVNKTLKVFPPPLSFDLFVKLFDEYDSQVHGDAVSFAIMVNGKLAQSVQIGGSVAGALSSQSTDGSERLAGLQVQGYTIGSSISMVIQPQFLDNIAPVALTLQVQPCPSGYVSLPNNMECKYILDVVLSTVIVGIIALIIVTTAAIIICYQCYKRRKQQKLVDRLLGNSGMYTSLLSNDKEEGDELESFVGNLPSKYAISRDDIKIGDMIGSGAQASLFSGVYQQSAVALKLFPKKTFISDEENSSLKEFENECMMLERFSNHPNILRFHGVVDFGNKIALVMELMKGSLASVIQKAAISKSEENEWSIEWDSKKRMLRGIAAACAFLHSHQVIHRDIKLENVLINEGEWDRVVLCDFGFSKATSEARATKNSTLNVGTATYMAPEVIGLQRGDTTEMQTYGKQADVYSYGILVAALLLETTRPWGELSDVDILFRVRQGNERPQIDDRTLYNACKNICDKNFLSQSKTNESILQLQKVIDLTRQCWSQDPEARPSFVDICKQLDALR